MIFGFIKTLMANIAAPKAIIRHWPTQYNEIGVNLAKRLTVQGL